MIYQLAKTSPLLTGQVKMNMIMTGDTVTDLQYSPISNYISFNYDNPDSTLNYSHLVNIKKLYNKISSNFFENTINPELSTSTLHRYNILYDDTHENAYEMGMKRLEYARYNKQFEFFCPFWCDDINEFYKIKFVLNIVNYKGDILLKKVINFSNQIKQYINATFKSFELSKTGKNSELLYIDFEKQESFIKGINVKRGIMEIKDTSYVIEDLLSIQKPVIETDNALLNLFSQNSIICTQLFNFNFVFDLFELLPLVFLKDMTLKNFNVYIDMYIDNKKVDTKDIYTNYNFIPKYDIYTGKYTKENVLDYMNDNKVNDLVDKNKLAQSIFHWSYYDNPNVLFNLYNGFSPLNSNYTVDYQQDVFSKDISEMKNCSAININTPNISSSDFNNNDNPFGLFKFANLCDKTNIFSVLNEYLADDSNYYSIDLTEQTLKEKYFQFFGNILLDNKKILEFKNDYSKKENSIQLSSKTNKKINSILEKKITPELTYAFLPKSISKRYSQTDNITGLTYYKLSDIKMVKCAMIELTSSISLNLLQQVLNTSYLITDYIKLNTANVSQNNTDFIAVRETQDTIYLIYFFKRINKKLSKQFENFFYFNNFYTNVFEIGKTLDGVETNESNNEKRLYGLTPIQIIYNVLNLVASLLKCVKFPELVSFSKSVVPQKEKNTFLNCNDINLYQTIEYIDLYRYSNMLIPAFIDLDDECKYNNVYWVKQYHKNFVENKKTHDIDFINDYINYQQTGLEPIYPEVNYFTLKKLDRVHYDWFYLDEYDSTHRFTQIKNQNHQYRFKKEKSWYKNNFFLLLPAEFTVETTKNNEIEFTESDILRCIYSYFEKYIIQDNKNRIKKLLLLHIKDLYSYRFTYDYTDDTSIKKQKYIIKFTLK